LQELRLVFGQFSLKFLNTGSRVHVAECDGRFGANSPNRQYGPTNFEGNGEPGIFQNSLLCLLA
jgi:hypothetical protein